MQVNEATLKVQHEDAPLLHDMFSVNLNVENGLRPQQYSFSKRVLQLDRMRRLDAVSEKRALCVSQLF